ncbi:MAG: PilZ domain-containing protein, partial [Deltaproteobacteria bacterium]|nr:PilZ domain-containing protein [Deltaproteobacteria bacterium]
MATTKGPTGSVDSGPEHRRFPRSAEKHRLFLIAGTQRFQAETVDISRTGMLAACPSLPPDVGKDS